ncbi:MULTISPECIES: phosphatase PAP2 family protein [unclassified Mesorhizobium]|uniref:phosphatase PAP2 family protein n=1 Tax=unclassified Mesorhizobium TaxID=325217 RepID=UPI0003CF11DC|nr:MULTISPECIES: phosphatase PAP2 family protein [unclassified Mesorhizobium]ESY51730.1 hypothetical protein X745_22965 [Mesorhizobium sp. LNJC374B00]ESY58779.1 hypothetical protein X744_17480 [Mesorhizobium sp. LNJC372A00]ESZ64715.1 hypothetical protein X729_03465 [Mesorhizobium sp. L103C131B0]WJI79055.1 phosphatase PAP2 family protein [Mesorhizobium sp. C374B]WJI85591.1 phosphatase PAP2 family protein [Mesorhizobium sp. C372A]
MKPDRLIVIPLVVAGLNLAALAVLLPRSTVTLDPVIVRSFGVLEAFVLALYLFSRFIVYRARDDQSRLGRAFVVVFNVAMRAALYLAIMVPVAVPAVVLSYLAAAAGVSLVDADLSALDAALAFDWLGFLALTNETAFAPSVLQFAYQSLNWQLAVVPIILIATSQTRCLLELAALIGLTVTLTVAISAVVPVIGPYGYYHPAPALFDAYSNVAGSSHLADFNALRSGEPFLLKRNAGIVSFPSFHTILAVLLAFALRATPYVRGPAIVLNSLLIVGAVPFGGHYLVDTLAGGAIAALSIYFVCFFRVGTARQAGLPSRAT